MVFLWTFNRSGYRDLTTAGLDTFHLDSVPTIARKPSYAANRISKSGGRQYVFKVVGDRFVVPGELQGTITSISMYNLNGRKLGSINVGNQRVVDLRKFTAVKGVVVVRVER